MSDMIVVIWGCDWEEVGVGDEDSCIKILAALCCYHFVILELISLLLATQSMQSICVKHQQKYSS